MHKGKALEAYKVWKRIRGIESLESREEFFLMKASVEEEEAEVAAGAGDKRFPWLDFFTVPRCRRAIVYANVMILLGQLTGYATPFPNILNSFFPFYSYSAIFFTTNQNKLLTHNLTVSTRLCRTSLDIHALPLLI
jgi:hypothetical protein